MSSSSAKPRRVKSAKARLTPTHPTETSVDKQEAVKEAQERVRSAKAIKDKHKGSTKVFPRPGSRASKERFSTVYSKDFEGSFAPAAELRPTSPTRRNNPHPGKQFMVWRLPDREIGVPQDPVGLELPPEYITRNSDFDAIEELHGGLGALKLPPPQPTSHEYGAYLRQQRQQREALQQQQLQQQGGGVRTYPMGPEVLDRTLRDDLAPNLQDWMNFATPAEKHVILKMLKSAEDAQVQETINDVMQPTAAKAVRKWMKTADNKEREVAVRLFGSLGSRSGKRQRSMSEPLVTYRPLSRQPLPPPLQGGASGQRLPSRQLASGSGPRGAKHPPSKPWPAGLWHHLPVRDPPPQVYHRGALFGDVRGDASHYNVHPEWPDYFNTSLNSDAVH